METELIVPPSAEVLYEELRRVRTDPRSSNARKVQAFGEWFRQSVAEGFPPDSLDQRIRDEVKRFGSQTIPGPDGHLFWNGAKRFKRNDGMLRTPNRWVWEHANGSLELRTSVFSACGEKHCIALGHLTAARANNRVYTDQAVIGALQVVTMQLGHTPTLTEWYKLGKRPHVKVVVQRFGSWAGGLKAAGLALPDYAALSGRKWQREDAIKSMLALKEELGHWPNGPEFDVRSVWLQERGLPPSRGTVKRRLGVQTWDEVVRVCEGVESAGVAVRGWQ